VFRRHLERWHATSDGEPIETPRSWLLPVRHAGAPAMLKLLKPGGDERQAAAMLHYYGGDGAVCLLAAADDALLMERAEGPRALDAMVRAGADLEAAAILAETVARLHAPRGRAAPAGLPSLRLWFAPLFDAAGSAPLLARCARIADALLAQPLEAGVLHGDLHHANVCDAGARGWLAIDPKGVIGEPAYEVANLLGNPWPHGEIVHDGARMQRLAALYAARLGLDPRRVLGFAFAHAGLAASWDIDDGEDPGYWLRCAEILAPLVEPGGA
jgi:streptomycin 6-kinase